VIGDQAIRAEMWAGELIAHVNWMLVATHGICLKRT
jgi:hypothetical protein